MSILGKLGKILLGVGAGVAAPLTGGSSLLALPTILGGAVGGLTGGVSKSPVTGALGALGEGSAIQGLMGNSTPNYGPSLSQLGAGNGSTTAGGLDFKKLLALVGIQGGLGFASGLFSHPNVPTGFSGQASNGVHLDPREILGNSLSNLYSSAGALQDKMSQPVNLKNSYAQPVQGLSGVDPAYRDRSLLQTPGFDFSKLPKGVNR